MPFSSRSPRLRPGLAAVAAALVLIPASAVAQDGRGATSQGTVTTEIVMPLRIAALNQLDFGCLVARDPGEVSIAAEDGSIAYAGGVRPVGGANCSHAPARFTVSGSAGREYRFLIDPAAIAVHESGSGETLEVRSLAGRARHAPGAGNVGTLDAAGADQLSVGGTLVVPQGTRPGRYRARITVTVAYM